MFMAKIVKVMVFGTFDLVHKGHEHFLNQARSHGDELFVVVARDATVEKVKRKTPLHNEEQRVRDIMNLGIADSVVLGNLDDPYKIIEELKPDVICLGYDQEYFVDKLSLELGKRQINAKIIRLKPHQPEKYKSSILKKKLGLDCQNDYSTKP